jgi:hypothetical protein
VKSKSTFHPKLKSKPPRSTDQNYSKMPYFFSTAGMVDSRDYTTGWASCCENVPIALGLFFSYSSRVLLPLHHRRCKWRGAEFLFL